jgi:hypothetical protein
MNNNRAPLLGNNKRRDELVRQAENLFRKYNKQRQNLNNKLKRLIIEGGKKKAKTGFFSPSRGSLLRTIFNTNNTERERVAAEILAKWYKNEVNRLSRPNTKLELKILPNSVASSKASYTIYGPLRGNSEKEEREKYFAKYFNASNRYN